LIEGRQTYSKRDITLDITRGLCVIAMAVHHCINYFPIYSLTYWRFVSGAFPFLAGYLSIASQQRNIGSLSDRSIGSKMFFRGIKLLILCFGINLIIKCMFPEMAKIGTRTLFQSMKVILFTGDYKNVSFSLLIPIGYVLSFSGIMYLIHKNKFIILLTISGILIIYCSINHYSNQTGFYVCYFTLGMLGILCGFIKKEKLKILKEKYLYPLILWLVAFVVISVYGQTFPFYSLYVLASVAICYTGGIWIKDSFKIFPIIAIHGQYSLLIYLSQIAILVIAKKSFNLINANYGVMNFWFALTIVIVLEWVILKVVDSVRIKNKIISTFYRFIFL
jgi:hypothetical protein